MESCTILLKTNIVHIYTMKSGYKEIDYRAAIGNSIDRNGHAILIFNEIWANNGAANNVCEDKFQFK